MVSEEVAILRRPIVLLLISFTFGIAFQYYANCERSFLISLFFVAVFLIGQMITGRLAGRFKVGFIFLVLLGTALIGCLYLQFTEENKDPLESLSGQRTTISGRVLTVQTNSEYTYSLLVKGEDHRKRLVRVKGSLTDPAEYAGRKIEVRGLVELPTGRRNPNLFNYRLYLKTKGIRVILTAYPEQITIWEDDSGFILKCIADVKYGFLRQLKNKMDPEQYGLMAGMLFGDRSQMSDETYESFQKNGIAHILSVSGIHVGIIYVYISKLLGRKRTLPYYLIITLILITYAALAEFSSSVVRASVMIIIHMMSKLTHQRYDFTCCSAASALFMLAVNPYYLFHTGFQLSYLAVFCLAVLLPWVNRKLDLLEETSEVIVKVLRYLAPLFVIQLGMAPLTAYYFNYFSLASFLINIPVLALSGFVIPIGITLIPLSFVNGFLFGIGVQAAELLLWGMIRFNDLFYLPGVGFFNMVSPSAGFLFLFYFLAFLLTSEWFRIFYQRKRFSILIVLCFAVLVVSVAVQTVTATGFEKAELIFVDVGQGDCLFIRTSNSKTILIDGGGNLNTDIGKNTLLPFLLKNKVRHVDMAIATHLHTDHFLGLAQLSQCMKIEKFGVYEANRFKEQELLDETGLTKEDMVYLSEGDRIILDQNVWIDVLYPPKRSESDYRHLLEDEQDENKISLFMKITYEDITVLMTGDLGMEGEAEIMGFYQNNSEELKCDILKVGHHGSRFSTGNDFLNAVDPEIAVFQVGKNNFGHPHQTVIDKCLEKGIMLYRNDLNGAVSFDKEDETWQIRTMLQPTTLSSESEKN